MTWPDKDDIVRPTFLVLALRARGDRAARAAADEGAGLLRATRRTVVVADEFPAADVEAPDGLLLVLADGADLAAVEAVAPRLAGRAVALAPVVDEAPEGGALAQRARKTLRAAGALVLERQVVLLRKSFGVYGLESEPQRERFEALAALLHHEADRLLAKREGWIEPDELDAEEADPRRRAPADVDDD